MRSLPKSLVSLTLLSSLLVGGCSTMSDWFADEEELEIRRLAPIEQQFEPDIIWDRELGDGVEQYYSRLRPVVGYDLLFAANRQGLVQAMQPDTGKVVWKQDFATYSDEGWLSGLSRLWSDGTSAKIAGGLSLAYEKLFFGSEDGQVFALDAKSGEQKWRVSVRGEVLSTPVTDSGMVLVHIGSGVLVALDAESGEEKWSFEAEVPPLSLRGISAPAAANGGAIVGTASGKLVVNIIESGQTAWEQPIAAPSGATELERIVDIDSQPLILGGTIFVISYDGTLAAVELRSGRVIWKREYQSYRRLSMAGNRLIVVDSKSNVYALDRRNGVELWSQSSLRNRVLTAATEMGDYLVVGDKWGWLHWLNAEDGRLVSRLDLGDDDEDDSIYAAPVVSDGVLYAQTREGTLAAIRTP